MRARKNGGACPAPDRGGERKPQAPLRPAPAPAGHDPRAIPRCRPSAPARHGNDTRSEGRFSAMLRLLGYLMLIPILILWIIFRRLRHALHTVCRLLRHVLLRNNGILQTCAEGGKAPAQHALGYCFCFGRGLPPSGPAKAGRPCRAARRGACRARGRLGRAGSFCASSRAIRGVCLYYS